MRSLRTATKSSPCSLQLEKAPAQQQRPNAAKNKEIKKKLSIALGSQKFFSSFLDYVIDDVFPLVSLFLQLFGCSPVTWLLLPELVFQFYCTVVQNFPSFCYLPSTL